ncbi:MAG: hypothetical protein QMC90_03150 [Dehalococcoidales bacterium]|nr:hypothetical protein [Dehalococcoidales bacterium]
MPNNEGEKTPKPNGKKKISPEGGASYCQCAYCKGRGKDRGILSFLSNCVVCSGRGVVRLCGPVKECAFCNGTGIQPYTASRLHCIACGGKEVVNKTEPSEECPTCKGRGINPRIVDHPWGTAPPVGGKGLCEGSRDGKGKG